MGAHRDVRVQRNNSLSSLFRCGNAAASTYQLPFEGGMVNRKKRKRAVQEVTGSMKAARVPLRKPVSPLNRDMGGRRRSPSRRERPHVRGRFSWQPISVFRNNRRHRDGQRPGGIDDMSMRSVALPGGNCTVRTLEPASRRARDRARFLQAVVRPIPREKRNHTYMEPTTPLSGANRPRFPPPNR